MTDLLPAEFVAPESTEDQRPATGTRIVLDTSVLIADPFCVTSFDDHDVVIPLTVVEELDGLKTRADDVGRAARTALRTIEELRVRHGGSLARPVPLGAGSLQIEINGIRKHLLVEHGLLQPRDRVEPLGPDPPPDAPLQRGRRILAEVEPVAPVDRLEQQLELEALELGVAGDVRVPVGVGHRYSHTRIRDRSWSVSTGFVM